MITYGLSNIIVNESVFRKQIDWLKNKNAFINDVLSCMTCLSFYIGVGLFLVMPVTLSGVMIVDILLAGILASGAINIIENIKNIGI
jgi:hypothetical protein